jgi:transposase
VTATCGIDWADDHHDLAVVDDQGGILATGRIGDDVDGLARLLQILAEHGDNPHQMIPIAIQTSHGLLVAALRAAGRPIYAINPLAAARYRERIAPSRSKSDHSDAIVLANILRTDAHHHRMLPADSELVRAIAVLARAHQDAAWAREQLTNQIRSLLREFFPAALAAFAGLSNGGLARPEARLILATAPTPTQAAALGEVKLRALLRAAGRQRNFPRRIAEIRHAFTAPALHQPPLIEDAMGAQLTALLTQLDAVCTALKTLEQQLTRTFEQHPDAAIITSFPGLSTVSGARLLAEIGDDPTRFTDARALKAYSGAAPVTRTSGKARLVLHRRAKNQRAAAVGYTWASAALTASPGARAHYDRRKARTRRHPDALRHLFNRFLGCLYHCLQTRQIYDEAVAFPSAP